MRSLARNCMYFVDEKASDVGEAVAENKLTYREQFAAEAATVDLTRGLMETTIQKLTFRALQLRGQTHSHSIVN